MVLTRYIFYFFKEWQEFCFILLSLMNIDIGVFVVVFKPSSVFQIYTSYRIVSKLYTYNNGIQSVLPFPLAKLWAGHFPLFIKQQKFLKISKLINSWKFDFRLLQTVLWKENWSLAASPHPPVLFSISWWSFFRCARGFSSDFTMSRMLLVLINACIVLLYVQGVFITLPLFEVPYLLLKLSDSNKLSGL